MNKKNSFISVSTILALLICLFAAVVIWLFAKYNAMADVIAATEMPWSVLLR